MSFPGSPRTLKGAIIGLDPLKPVASTIFFQYNPDTMTRSIEARSTGGGDSREGHTEPYRLSGPPKETIKVNIHVDATDQLERGNPLARTLGIHPQLAALEMLLFDKSARVIANSVLGLVGTLEVIPPEAPMTLFMYGLKRILPVRISGFTITEEQHDTRLNPIRANVELSMQVLGYNDFPMLHPGYFLYLSHHITKEVMANLNTANRAAGLFR